MYEGMKKSELQELCRDRGLPVSGNVEELVARLEDADDNDLLAAATEADAQPAPEVTGIAPDGEGADMPGEASETLGDQAKGTDNPSGMLDPDDTPPPGSFIASYALPREGHTTELHHMLLRRVVEDAFAAGRTPRAQTAQRVATVGRNVYYQVMCR